MTRTGFATRWFTRDWIFVTFLAMVASLVDGRLMWEEKPGPVDIDADPFETVSLAKPGHERVAYEYNKTDCKPRSHDVEPPQQEQHSAVFQQAPEFFLVTLRTTVSDVDVVVGVNRTWAPLGADRFYALALDHYYDCAALFRVVPNFVVQWGIASEPSQTRKWNVPIEDDPVQLSNEPGWISFATAGPNTRTTQIFVNLVDNSRLDAQGFAPFAKVMQGFEEVFLSNHLNVPDPTPDQEKYSQEGNDWILREYPEIDIIKGSMNIVVGEELQHYSDLMQQLES